MMIYYFSVLNKNYSINNALDHHPDCDICHCCLSIIDQNSNAHKDLNCNDFYAQKYYGDHINKAHIRKAPLDGILHFSADLESRKYIQFYKEIPTPKTSNSSNA